MGLKNEDLQTKATFRVQRPVYQTEELNEVTVYEYHSTNMATTFKEECISFNPKKCFYDTFPILKWLFKYDVKEQLLGDIFSGITVATIHIPHGLAYGILGNLTPIVGIYMGFFPVLVYVVFGTSRHISLGTFAIISLMTGKIVLEYSSEVRALDNGTEIVNHYTPIQVATTVTFTVSVLQMIMYLFKLGIITVLLSEALVNAFTCATAFSVVMTQAKDLMDVTPPKRGSVFRFIYTLYDLASLTPKANIPTVIMSLIFVTVLAFSNEILKPALAKKTRIPLPIELIAVIVGTFISYLMDLNKNYDVKVVGFVPTGLPSPDLPVFSLMPSVVLDCIIITIVSYTVSISLAFMMARKNHYDVDPNQELLAMSFSNGFGSFFSCMPITASLLRTKMQEAGGGTTQIASVVSCFILLMVLLWIGPFFNTLPKCVLASIIIVALKSMMMQFVSLKKYWKLSKWDSFVWIVTFLTTLLIGIEYGLLSGVLVSLVSVFVQGQKSYTCLLGVVPSTELYLDVQFYKGVQELPGIKIFHYCGSLSFASALIFKSLLLKKTGFDPMAWFTTRKASADLPFRCVILDFTALTYIDPSGVGVLKVLLDDYQTVGVNLYVCGCSGPVFEVLRKCERYEGKRPKFMIFLTIHDAVLFIQAQEHK